MLWNYLNCWKQKVGSVNGNCSILDSTNTLSVIKKKHYREDIFQNIESLPENKIVDHDYFGNINNINGYVEDVSVYIAGFIAMKILKKTSCEYCKTFLIMTKHDSKLANIKDRGGLIKPSTDVQTVCIETEKVFRQYTHDIILKRKTKQYVVLKVKSNLLNRYDILFNNMPCVNKNIVSLFDFAHQFNTHRDDLIKQVCETYFNIRFFHEVKKANDKLIMRAKYTKLIHFGHE